MFFHKNTFDKLSFCFMLFYPRNFPLYFPTANRFHSTQTENIVLMLQRLSHYWSCNLKLHTFHACLSNLSSINYRSYKLIDVNDIWTQIDMDIIFTFIICQNVRMQHWTLTVYFNLGASNRNCTFLYLEWTYTAIHVNGRKAKFDLKTNSYFEVVLKCIEWRQAAFNGNFSKIIRSRNAISFIGSFKYGEYSENYLSSWYCLHFVWEIK